MAKKKKAKLPKKILGVKLSKSLRRGPLAQVIASPLAQVAIAEMIYHVGAALGERNADGSIARASERAGHALGRMGDGTAEATSAATAHLLHAFREGTNAFIGALRSQREDAVATEPEDHPEDTGTVRH